MLKLTIKEVDGYNYTLVSSNGKEYKINIEFYGIKNKPKKDDIIYMSQNLLRKVDNFVCSFGPLEEEYGRKIENEDDEDLICLKLEDEMIYLKRFYG